MADTTTSSLTRLSARTVRYLADTFLAGSNAFIAFWSVYRNKKIGEGINNLGPEN